MLKQKLMRMPWSLCARLLALVCGMFFATHVFAAGATGITLTSLQTHIKTGVGSVASILGDVALVAGIGFIFASFFKFHQHKMNPTQVPLSQGITLLLIGAALAVFPHLLNTTSEGIFGTGLTKAGSTTIKSLVVS